MDFDHFLLGHAERIRARIGDSRLRAPHVAEG